MRRVHICAICRRGLRPLAWSRAWTCRSTASDSTLTGTALTAWRRTTTIYTTFGKGSPPGFLPVRPAACRNQRSVQALWSVRLHADERLLRGTLSGSRRKLCLTTDGESERIAISLPLRGYGVRGVSNRLMVAAASGHLRRRRPIEFGRVVVGLPAHRCSAISTDVVVLTATRQNEQELSPRWSRAATARAKEAGRLELAEGIGPGHDLELYTRNHTHGERLGARP